MLHELAGADDKSDVELEIEMDTETLNDNRTSTSLL